MIYYSTESEMNQALSRLPETLKQKTGQSVEV